MKTAQDLGREAREDLDRACEALQRASLAIKQFPGNADVAEAHKHVELARCKLARL